MICYAVNRETKEHRRADGIWQQMKYGTDWKIVQGDIDGWIPWGGGECPLPDGSGCQFVNSFGFVGRLGNSAHGIWGSATSIVSYRPIIDEPREPEVAEWDGEGLPPVGMCEANQGGDNTFFECEVVAHHYITGRPIVRTARAGSELTQAPECWKFRPIRSEEDRAVEAMLALDDYDTESYNSGMMSRYDFCRALYRDGYRKS